MNDFTNIQSILDGCLLGDGHLEKNKNGINACFSYGSSSKEHTEYVFSFFKIFSNYVEIKKTEIFDKRTNKTYLRYWFRTKCLPFFTEQRNRYYPFGVKIVPKNIIINSNVLLFWYIGDGELESRNGYIKLHTNSFSLDDVIFLSDKLKEFNGKPKLKDKNQYIITIPRNNVKKFLKNIGNCPINDYKHKWKFVEYINKNIELNGMNFYKKKYPLLIEDFKSGNFTIYELHKKYNIPIKAIKNHFNVNNIKWIPVDNKKFIIQYDLLGYKINEWKSGQEIKKILKLNPSSVSKCCLGHRKTCGGYKWKFKN